MLPNKRSTIPDLNVTEDTGAFADTKIVREEEDSLPSAAAPETVDKNTPGASRDRADDTALSVATKSHGRAFDTPTGPPKPSGGTKDPRTKYRVSGSDSSEKVGSLAPKTREPTDDGHSVHNNSSSNGNITAEDAPTAVAASNNTGTSSLELSPINMSEMMNVSVDLDKVVANFIHGTDLVQTADDSDWNRNTPIPHEMQCSCSHRISPGGTVTACKCNNIGDLKELDASFDVINVKPLSNGERLRPFIQGLWSPPSAATEVRQQPLAPATASASAPLNRKRKSDSPMEHPSSPKKKSKENTTPSASTNVNTSLEHSIIQARKRKSATIPSSPPSPKRTRRSSSVDRNSDSTAPRKRSASEEHTDSPPTKLTVLQSTSSSSASGTGIASSDSQSTSRKRQSSAASDDSSSPSKRFLCSTPTHLSSIHRRRLPSLDVSSIRESTPVSADSSAAPKSDALIDDDVPLQRSTVEQQPSGYIDTTSNSFITATSRSFEYNATTSNSSVSDPTTAESTGNDSDVKTAREPSPLPPPQVAPLPVPQLPPQVVPAPVPAAQAVALALAKQDLQRRLNDLLKGISEHLKDICSDKIERAKDVLDLVCKLQRQRSTLRRLVKELPSRNTMTKIETDFTKVERRLVDISAAIGRFRKRQK